MRAVLMVLMFLGAFLSIAGIEKVFSKEPESPLVHEVIFDSLLFEPTNVSQFIDSSTIPVATSSSEKVSSAAAAPASNAALAEPDFCLDVPVLMYHHTEPLETAGLLGHAQLTVDSTVFDTQIKYLVDTGYTFISAEDLVRTLLDRRTLGEKTIVVTIDDGYKDNYTYAFLVAKKYKVVMNFMIPTELVGKADYMTWDHLKEMVQSPYARIYNHTATHAPLGYLSAEQIEWELATSSAALKENLGLINTVFTYPYGTFSDLAIEKVKEHGFVGAFTTIQGQQQCQSQIMQLQRLRIGNIPLESYGL